MTRHASIDVDQSGSDMQAIATDRDADLDAHADEALTRRIHERHISIEGDVGVEVARHVTWPMSRCSGLPDNGER